MSIMWNRVDRKYLMIILSRFLAAVFGELGKRLVDTPADGASETW